MRAPIRAKRLIKFDLIILWTLKPIFQQHTILLINFIFAQTYFTTWLFRIFENEFFNGWNYKKTIIQNKIFINKLLYLIIINSYDVDVLFWYFRNKDHWWGLRSESKRLKVCNFLSYHFWTLKPIININIVYNYYLRVDTSPTL